MSFSPVTVLLCPEVLSTNSARPAVCEILVMRAVSGTLFAGRQLAPIRAFSSVDLPAEHEFCQWSGSCPVADRLADARASRDDSVL